jgi:flagella basal body P-ring formation protein FlgA
MRAPLSFARRVSRALGGACLLAVLPVALPVPAWASPTIQLLRDVTVSGGQVTLGDLFSDAGSAASVVVARMPPGQTVVLDATQVQLIARTNGVDWGNPANLRRISVQSAAPEPEAARPEARKARTPSVLTYLHSLNAGDVVQAEDLTWSHDSAPGADAPRDADAVIGKAARRPLREGDAVSLRDISTPIAIHKDDVIAVTFTQDGLSLTLQAKSLADAAIGQPVSVINPGSKKVIQAVATGPGQAVIGPAADQFKPAVRISSNVSDSSHLALR